MQESICCESNANYGEAKDLTRKKNSYLRNSLSLRLLLLPFPWYSLTVQLLRPLRPE